MAESTLFQQHTKQWLEEVLETNLKRNGKTKYPGLPVKPVSGGEKNQNSDESQTKVTVTEFQTEILEENEKRPFPRQMPILKIRVKSQVGTFTYLFHILSFLKFCCLLTF